MLVVIIERFKVRILGLKLMNCYGVIEMMLFLMIMLGEFIECYFDSVGLLCLGVCIVVMDIYGCVLLLGEIGEFWICSVFVIWGYWNNLKVIVESFMVGFWYLGDFGFVDVEGFVCVFDR